MVVVEKVHGVDIEIFLGRYQIAGSHVVESMIQIPVLDNGAQQVRLLAAVGGGTQLGRLGNVDELPVWSIVSRDTAPALAELGRHLFPVKQQVFESYHDPGKVGFDIQLVPFGPEMGKRLVQEPSV